MTKKLASLLLLALLLLAPASFAADPDPHDILKNPMWMGLIAPERLGTKMLPDLKESAVQVQTGWPTTINLTTVDMAPQHIDQTTITFSADLKGGNDFVGNAYIEMWIHVPGGYGGNFHRSTVDRPLLTKQPWSRASTTFTLMRGQMPDKAYLNLVINGKGSVWIRNVQFTHNP